MAKRISMDAIIVLRNAGYEVEQINPNRRGVPTAIKATRGAYSEELPVVSGCVENAPIEELLTHAKRLWNF